MSVGREEAERIAALARLRFDEDELARITEELNHILQHVEALREVVDVPASEADAVPEGDVTRGSGAERPDRLALELRALAPDFRQGFFVVPPLPGMHAEDGP